MYSQPGTCTSLALLAQGLPSGTQPLHAPLCTQTPFLVYASFQAMCAQDSSLDGGGGGGGGLFRPCMHTVVCPHYCPHPFSQLLLHPHGNIPNVQASACTTSFGWGGGEGGGVGGEADTLQHAACSHYCPCPL